jgi:methylphosphotriester-DNA--protein-cysteine methyltransferase
MMETLSRNFLERLALSPHAINCTFESPPRRAIVPPITTLEIPSTGSTEACKFCPAQDFIDRPVFRETTGTTPLQWLCTERVRLAQDLLENTDKSVDHIATLCGLGSAQVLRTHFTRINQVTPHEFRRIFHSGDGD